MSVQSSSTDLTDIWRYESEQFSPEPEDFDTAACAELADELELFEIQADADPNFGNSYFEWDEFVCENELWLPLEQSCGDGVLLPMDQRALRVQTCPETVLRKLRWFFECCPTHVKHYLALTYYLLVRMDRARRTGSPEWRPHTAQGRPPLEDSAFFRPPKLTVRRYTG